MATTSPPLSPSKASSGLLLVNVKELATDVFKFPSGYCIFRVQNQIIRSTSAPLRNHTIQWNGEDFFFFMDPKDTTLIVEIYDDVVDIRPVTSVLVDVSDVYLLRNSSQTREAPSTPGQIAHFATFTSKSSSSSSSSSTSSPKIHSSHLISPRQTSDTTINQEEIEIPKGQPPRKPRSNAMSQLSQVKKGSRTPPNQNPPAPPPPPPPPSTPSEALLAPLPPPLSPGTFNPSQPPAIIPPPPPPPGDLLLSEQEKEKKFRSPAAPTKHSSNLNPLSPKMLLPCSPQGGIPSQPMTLRSNSHPRLPTNSTMPPSPNLYPLPHHVSSCSPSPASSPSASPLASITSSSPSPIMPPSSIELHNINAIRAASSSPSSSGGGDEERGSRLKRKSSIKRLLQRQLHGVEPPQPSPPPPSSSSGETSSSSSPLTTTESKCLPGAKKKNSTGGGDLLDQTKYEWSDLWFQTACGKGKLHLRFLFRPFRPVDSQQDRSSVLLRQQASVDEKALGRYGFPVADCLLNDPDYSAWLSEYYEYECKSAQKWFSVLKSGTSFYCPPPSQGPGPGTPTGSGTSIKHLVRKGIPPSLRPRAWGACISPKKQAELRGYYDLQLIKYDLEGASSISTGQIEKDLLRTYPNHPLYTTKEGIASLRRVLTAYAVHNQSIGYCQSMNFVCGILLLFLDEERAFWVLCHIVDVLYPTNYTYNLLGVQIETNIILALAQEKLPKLMNHLAALDFSLKDHISKWILQLFINILPFETVLRVFDVFLIEGPKAMVRFSLAILKMNEQKFLNCQSFEDMWAFMDSMPSKVFDVKTLIATATNGKVLGSFGTTEQLRAKFAKKIKKEALDSAFNSIRKNSNFSESETQKLFKRVQGITSGSERMDFDQWNKLISKVWSGTISSEVAGHFFHSLPLSDEHAKVEDVLVLFSSLMRGSDDERLFCCCRAFISKQRAKEEEGMETMSMNELEMMITSFTKCLDRLGTNSSSSSSSSSSLSGSDITMLPSHPPPSSLSINASTLASLMASAPDNRIPLPKVKEHFSFRELETVSEMFALFGKWKV